MFHFKCQLLFITCRYDANYRQIISRIELGEIGSTDTKSYLKNDHSRGVTLDLNIKLTIISSVGTGMLFICFLNLSLI